MSAVCSGPAAAEGENWETAEFSGGLARHSERDLQCQSLHQQLLLDRPSFLSLQDALVAAAAAEGAAAAAEKLAAFVELEPFPRDPSGSSFLVAADGACQGTPTAVAEEAEAGPHPVELAEATALEEEVGFVALLVAACLRLQYPAAAAPSAPWLQRSALVAAFLEPQPFLLQDGSCPSGFEPEVPGAWHVVASSLVPDSSVGSSVWPSAFVSLLLSESLKPFPRLQEEGQEAAAEESLFALGSLVVAEEGWLGPCLVYLQTETVERSLGVFEHMEEGCLDVAVVAVGAVVAAVVPSAVVESSSSLHL